ncbi:methyl-accepting chemotaxis protein [Phenylobacterium immobile]|uniref:methyl-accepting chemotaxis protein n=1 Tax=Phenylobacterium immobile TaxID=21 RepID=UPI000AC2B23F|nr:methyl-accepting chemotaxis protein [Phenylobacterium immobile]
MTIANRILTGFAAAAVLMVALGLFGLMQIGSVRNDANIIVARDVSFVKQAASARVARFEMQVAGEQAYTQGALRASGRAGDPRPLILTWRAKGAEAQQILDRTAQLAAEYEQSAIDPDRGRLWASIRQRLETSRGNLQSLRTGGETFYQALERGDVDEATRIRGELAGSRDSFADDMAAVSTAMDQMIALGRVRVDRAYAVSRYSTFGGLLVAMIVALSVALFVRRSIVGPLEQFMAFVDRVGRGDLSGQPARVSKDEIGQLGANLNRMVEGLKELARRNREATENLNAAAAEIRASTQEQAASVEEQLAAVQETAATVDEITHSGAQIGKRAQEVIASAQAAAQTSQEGLRAVDETARAMGSIGDQAEAVAENIVALSEKTQAIGDIIATVNDISERSHLLALNAAIEAAAAGENGRSFAVVASEMKMLADQAKDATSQVRAILGDIQRGINASVMLTEEAVKRVGAGRERIDVTQRTITEITGRVQEGVQTFQQIVASTNQQQLGIEQVMGALQNIRQASQQTAAGTRQLDEAAGNLTSLSQDLLALADRYRI